MPVVHCLNHDPVGLGDENHENGEIPAAFNSPVDPDPVHGSEIPLDLEEVVLRFQIIDAVIRGIHPRAAHPEGRFKLQLEGQIQARFVYNYLDDPDRHRSGFEVTQVHERTAHLRFADGGALLRHSFIRIGFLGDWKAIVGAASRARVFEHLERALDELAAEKGCLDLSVPLAYVEARRGARPAP